MSHTSPSRKRLIRAERYAAVILELKRGTGEYLIPRDRAKSMSVEEIIAEYERFTHADHIVPVAVARDIGWSTEQINHPANIQIIPIEDHAEKTARDIPAIAKGKRIAASEAVRRAAMAAKAGLEPETEAPAKRRRKGPKLQGRAFPKAPAGTRWDWKLGRRVKTEDNAR